MPELLEETDIVIFDFGEVLIELDYERVINGFSDVANKNQLEIKEMVVTAPLLQDFEVGRLSPAEFRAGVNELLGTSMDDAELDGIWNSMLKSLPASRMELLEKAGKHFETYVLSNSNVIHEMAFNQMIEEVTGKASLHEFVEKCYFSQDIGLRKPYISCYEYVIKDIDHDPSRMLFLDDRLDNIEGAKQAGLKAVQVTDADRQLHELFGNG